MANKRKLKKQLNATCQELAALCLMLNSTARDTDTEKFYDVAVKALKLRAKSMHRASFSFDKSYKEFASVKEFNSAKKKYFATGYKTMITEFENDLEVLVKEMNSLRPKFPIEAFKEAIQKAEKQA